MKKTLLLATALLLCFWVSAQSEKDYGTVVNFNLTNFKNNSLQAVSNNGLVSKLSVDFPLYNGLTAPFVFDETLISTQKINNIQTFDAVSSDGKSKMKLTVTPSGMSGIMHTSEGYFFIETVNLKNNQYRIYKSSEVKNANITCDQHETPVEINTSKDKNKRILSIAPFPVGTQLRTYKLAAAATGEMTTLYGSQDLALAQIVAIANANNLIYELEASMKFELAIQTTNKSIIFTNPATDPFTPISVDDCQNGFNTMNTNGTLPYSAYGTGHTFNTLPSAGPNSFSGNGVAGPSPCVDAAKSRGFTQWTLGSPISLIIGIFTHELAHQFSAWHTYNAIGGTASANDFCIKGWDANTAIEPGSGTTMMSYANNCINPTNYTITGKNELQYFNTKSLEQIFNSVNVETTGGAGSCMVKTATNNIAPVVGAMTNITIPKGTPFTLNGSATDANGDPMTYTWEQYDVASADDKGALGSAINGTGGYPAVNSTTAPLFRSEQSSTSTSRTFPKMIYIANNANNPADNEGEDLPQVARTMKFRFTVRDNKAGGGGVDSDQITVTVNNTGPLEVSAFNTAQTVAAGSSQTVTWNVNNTNTLVANVKILFSVDEGKTFPYVLSNSTPNNGSATVTIPANIANGVNQGRIKVTCEINSNAEFFDLNNANITVTSSCLAKVTVICSDSTITGVAGNSVLNLGLSFVTGSGVTNFSKTYPTTGLSSYPVVNHTNNTYTTCQVAASAPTNAVLVPFRVTKKGNYSFSSTGTGGDVVWSIFTSNSTFNCSTFIGSNAYSFELTSGSNPNPKIIALNECTTYYALLYIDGTPTSATFNIQSQGTGEVIEVQPNQAGFNYTYVAVNQANSQITAVNATADFRTLSAGTYRVQGLSYISTFDPATLVNQTVAQAIASGSCILFSNNTKPVTVTGGTTVAPPTASAQTRCAGQTVATLVATGTAIQWYAAMTGGTALATSTVLAAGTYYASQTVGGVESTRTAVVVTVNALTTPSVSISPTTLCAGVTQTITTTPTNGGTATYLWKKNNVNFATTQNISITTAVAGDVYSLVMTPSADVCPNPATPTATASLTVGPACISTITSVASGNWETAATWDLNRIPTAADIVVIAASHNVTVTTNDANAKKVETRSNGKVIFNDNTTKLKLGF
jgi:Metallo-peptidase family M12B Reprolysin-like